MVRYIDIIKNGAQKGKQNDAENQPHLKNTDNSVRFSTLKEFTTSPVLHILPAQKDDEYMKKLYGTIVSYVSDVKRLINNDEDFDIQQAVDILSYIIRTPELIGKLYQSVIFFYPPNGSGYLVHHLIKVMLCALNVATGLKYSKEDLLEVGLAALFYDVGLFKIVQDIKGKRENLTESELKIIKEHTEIGSNILSRFDSEHPMMSRVAREHHERENGSGYPMGLRGNEICEYAKIIGLCDAFDAMIHDRPYRKSLEQHFSVKELVRSRDSMFSSKIIKAFLDELGIFPVGSYVRLNNSQIGRVIATNKENPLKPTIKVIIDGQGKRVFGPENENIINIKEHPVLYITAAIGDEELISLGIIK
jgi:HD-GYP domain-containing protein (c-di-GMP phosphodiesterase class II)